MKNNRVLNILAGIAFLISAIYALAVLRTGYRPFGIIGISGYILVALGAFINLRYLTSLGSAMALAFAVKSTVSNFDLLHQQDYSYIFYSCLLFVIFWFLLLIAGLDNHNSRRFCFQAVIAGIVRLIVSVVPGIMSFGWMTVDYVNMPFYLLPVLGALFMAISYPEKQ